MIEESTLINLSSTPTAPNGGTNVIWQNDTSGNVSAYIAIVKTTVAPVSGVLTINAALGNSFLITVNAAITSMAITNPTDGQEITLLFQQDTSGHAVTLASNLMGAIPVTTTASTTTGQPKFTYNVGDENWYALGVANM